MMHFTMKIFSNNHNIFLRAIANSSPQLLLIWWYVLYNPGTVEQEERDLGILKIMSKDTPIS